MGKLQIGCFIITVFIMILYFSVKRISTRSHKVYSALLIVSVLYLIFDRVTVYTVNHIETVPALWNQIMHRCFLMSLVACIYLIYRYVLLMIFREHPTRRGSFVLLILSIIAAGGLPLYYRITEKGNYSYGPAAYVTYVTVAVYTGMLMYSLIRNYKKMEKKKREIILLTVIFQVAVSIYQAVFPLSLISCLGITLVNLGFFLTVESPDVHLIEQLKEEKELADGANRAKSTFLASMSHEIRTPIHAVMGMSEMILRESKEEETLSYAGDIHSAAGSLLSIVNDILDFSKIESGRMEILPVSYQLSSLIHDIYLLIADRAEKKGLVLRIHVDEALPSTLYGDDIRLKQIVINLLTNAVKYTESGSVTLNITGTVQNEICELSVQVKDTGIGIRKEDIRKLFQVFERIEEKRNRTIEGTGLGINITQQLLTLMGSTLQVESVYGEGSCFSFRLKQKVIQREPIGNLEECLQNEKRQEVHRAGFRAPDVHVLVTDDIEMNRRVFRGLLKQTEIRVEEAASGQESLIKAREEKYDLIFMDNMMPDMDGIETMQRMRADVRGKNTKTPIIMLTANAIAGVKEEYERAGFDGYLSKPIDPKKLEAMICRFLSEDRILGFGEDEAVKTEATGRPLPELNGIRWEYARLYIPDDEMLWELLKGFRQTLTERIQEWNRDIPEGTNAVYDVGTDMDLATIRIEAHALKSLAASVGAMTIFGLARVTELAARENDVGKVKQVLPLLIEEMKQMETELAVQFPEEERPLCEDREQLLLLVRLLVDAMRSLDFDEVDRLEEKLGSYRYPEQIQEPVNQIQKAVRHLDDRTAVEIGTRLIQVIEEDIYETGTVYC